MTHDQEQQLLATLKGAESALLKALVYLPPDTTAVYCGEWLEEVQEKIKTRGLEL